MMFSYLYGRSLRLPSGVHHERRACNDPSTELQRSTFGAIRWDYCDLQGLNGNEGATAEGSRHEFG